jgi:hypothetical protein
MDYPNDGLLQIFAFFMFLSSCSARNLSAWSNKLPYSLKIFSIVSLVVLLSVLSCIRSSHLIQNRLKLTCILNFSIFTPLCNRSSSIKRYLWGTGRIRKNFICIILYYIYDMSISINSFYKIFSIYQKFVVPTTPQKNFRVDG